MLICWHGWTPAHAPMAQRHKGHDMQQDAYKEKAPTSDQASGAFQNLHADSTKEATFLIARMATAGHIVIKESNFAFTVHRWGMSRYLENFAALQKFAIVLGVRDAN